MPDKQRRDHKTAAQGIRSLRQKHEKEQHVQAMNENAGQVVIAGVELKQLIIQSMGEPCQWMPVRLLRCGQRPAQQVPVQTRSYVGILINIAVVVVINELVRT